MSSSRMNTRLEIYKIVKYKSKLEEMSGGGGEKEKMYRDKILEHTMNLKNLGYKKPQIELMIQKGGEELTTIALAEKALTAVDKIKECNDEAEKNLILVKTANTSLNENVTNLNKELQDTKEKLADSTKISEENSKFLEERQKISETLQKIIDNAGKMCNTEPPSVKPVAQMVGELQTITGTQASLSAANLPLEQEREQSNVPNPNQPLPPPPPTPTTQTRQQQSTRQTRQQSTSQNKPFGYFTSNRM